MITLPARTIALLGDVGDPEVRTYGRYSAPTGAFTYSRQLSPYARIEKVTAMATHLLQLDFIQHGKKESPSVEARFPLELTEAGRAYLEGLT